VAQSIIKCVTSCKIDFEDKVAFLPHNVTYMRKCFKDILKALFKNCCPVTCVAHILALVGDCWRINLKEVDSFIG